MIHRADWNLPQVDHPDLDMVDRQRRAVRNGERPLPYPGLPRDWTQRAVDVVLMFDPDKVFVFGSVWRKEDTIRSDIDLLVAFEAMPVDVWTSWQGEISYVSRFFCPYPVNAFVTDVEDLTRMRRVVVSPCNWAQRDGHLVFDKRTRDGS